MSTSPVRDFHQSIEIKLQRVRAFGMFWSVSSLLMLALLFTFTLNEASKDTIWSRASLKILYAVRSHLGQDPKMSDRLKLFMFEDRTVGELKATHLNLDDWFKILSTLDGFSPAAIYIDKVFGMQQAAQQELELMASRMSLIRTPIYSAAFATDQKLTGWQTIDKSRFLEVSEKSTGYKTYQFGYGASSPLSKFFAPGHVLQSGQSFFMPYVNIKEFGLIPHLGLSSIALVGKPQSLWVTENVAPILFLKNEQLVQNSYPLSALLNKQNRLKDIIKKDDHILIIPSAFTGNVDFKDSPVGRILGGFFVASIINSVLTNQWASDFGSGYVAVLFLIFLGFLLGLLRGSKGMFYSFCISLAIVISGIALFCYFSVVIPWLQSSTAILLSGSIIGGFKAREQAERARLLSELNAILSVDNMFEKERKQNLLRERKDAILVAQTFKPEPLPTDLHEPQLYAFHQSADEASGDWFFVRCSEDGSLVHIVMCDVVGHGMHAAMIVACCKATLSTLEKSNPSCFESMNWSKGYIELLNDILFVQGQGQHCATFCSVTIAKDRDINSAPKPGTFLTEVITCGHPPVLLIQTNPETSHKSYKAISSRSDMIGISKTISMHSVSMELTSVDSLLLHTDGLPISSRFHTFRKMTLGLDLDAKYPEKLTKHIWDQIFEKTGERCDDDISVILCNFNKTAS